MKQDRKKMQRVKTYGKGKAEREEEGRSEGRRKEGGRDKGKNKKDKERGELRENEAEKGLLAAVQLVDTVLVLGTLDPLV